MNYRNLLEAAMMIRNDPRFAEFRAFIDAEQDIALQSMLTAIEPNHIYNAQGGHKALTRVKNLIEDAPASLDKMARVTPQT